MEHLVLIFWVIIILISIISSIAKKKMPEKKEEGEGERSAHQERLERLLGVFSGEEQPQPVILTTQTKAAPEAPLPPQIQSPQLPPQPPREEQGQHRQRSVIASGDIIGKEQEIWLLKKEMDIDLIRQGIILSEVLGPPRAEKPFQQGYSDTTSK